MGKGFQRAYSGAPWEGKVGYCRAIRAGDFIYVTGTAPVDEQGGCFAPGKAYEQAKRCLEIIQKALQDLGTNPEKGTPLATQAKRDAQKFSWEKRVENILSQLAYS